MNKMDIFWMIIFLIMPLSLFTGMWVGYMWGFWKGRATKGGGKSQ